ncbi:MAG: hypothetical protein CVV64_12145 [Candidatus Wallbacteria bacterium HGW-Wallbacteria-1]|jgi:hypothetical protein|uniref:Uncharacterized protein n=1 Tax=Candidatus Wallbacteria bacterium HGW-Wallbacteria-1 TaxID=2013854 RepID=A0A2N1PNG6_9BACT|nr:MAG: hypothetical protein CVV64_12145 [Candidatus Wallbacteria bacterium HGW-Wallbacteria-1]
MRTGNFVNKGSNEVIIELHNPVTGIVKAHRYSSKPDGIKVTLSQRRGKVFTPLATISGDTIDSFLKNSELCLANPELASECREGLIKFQGLSAGAYRIQVTTALAELPLIGRFKPMFDDSTRNFSIGSIGNHSERLKIRVDFSTAGKIFLTGLVFISFMVFFIGMTIIVVQKAAFPGMRAVAAVGLAILALGWASTLPKMPLGYSLPAALVQFTAFLAIWLKRDFSSLPLPFVAKTCAESRQQLLYTNATLAAATVRGRRSRALAHDKWGNGVSLWIQRYDGDIELPAGAEVCLIDYSPETDIFMVQTNEEVTAVDKAI